MSLQWVLPGVYENVHYIELTLKTDYIQRYSLLIPVVNRLYHPARIANSYAIVRNRTGDYAACAYDAATPDGHAWQYHHAAANPRAVAYFHGQGIRKAKLAIVRAVVGKYALGVTGRVCGGVYLHVRGYEHVVAYLDDVVVYEGAVHVDYHPVADHYVAAVLAVKVYVDMHALPHSTEQLAEYLPFCFRVGIIGVVKFACQAFSPCRNGRYFRVAAVKRLSCEAFFKFGFHFQLMIEIWERIIVITFYGIMECKDRLLSDK